MASITRLLPALALAGASTLAACGDDGGQAAYDKTAFCSMAQALVPTEPTAVTTLDGALAEYSARAAAWRALLQVSPDTLDRALTTLADAAVARVQSLVDIKPTTLDELHAAAGPLEQSIVDRFGDLTKESGTVNDFTQAECGVAVTED